MIKSIIIDDEQPCIEALKSDIIKYCSNIEICATCLSGKEGVLAIKKYHPRLIFLDVEMPWMNGFEMLEMLDHIDFCIVFTTAYDKFAARAFRISAVDYLLKPVDEDRLIEAMQRVEKRLMEKGDDKNIDTLLYNLQRTGYPNEMKLCIPTLKGFVVLKLDDIIVCEAEKNYTIIHLRDKKPLIVSRPLMEYERILEGTSFLRVHKTWLINLQHVNEYHRGEGGVVIMSNGAEVEISRRKKEQFLARIRGVFRC